MAHIEGKSLRQVIKEGKLTVDQSIGLTMEICEGLQKAHESGVVHRDIKPANIIIDKSNKPRILDFGLATVSGEEKLTKTGSTIGTVGYMSPEQTEGKQVDHRSDLFSVGVILYEMLAGRRPFDGDNDAAVVRAITDTTPEPIARYKSGTTGELQQIVDKALSKDPSLRYQHADGMLADLKRLTIESGATKKKRLGLVMAAATVVVIVAGYIGYLTFYGETDQVTGPKRLVVLPFDNLGGEDQDYFASGMTDEVIARLSEISGLSVASSMTATQLKQAEVDLKKVGDSLGADYVLDASVRYQMGSDGTRHVRLTTQLINVSEDRVVWSQTYDTVMTEVFSVQANIAEQVSEKMNVILLEKEKVQVWKRWTTSQEAYDFYLQGKRYVGASGGFGPLKDFQRGAEMYRKAIALDSNFALAYSALSWAYAMHCDRGFCTDSIKQAAYEAVQKALEIDPSLRDAGVRLAWYYYLCEDDANRAQEQLDKAYQDDPDQDYYYSVSHIFLRALGRFGEAIEKKKVVVERQPTNVFGAYALAQTLLCVRGYDEAEELLDRVISMRPDFIDAYKRKVNLYLDWKGDIERVHEVIRESYSMVDSADWHDMLTWLYLKEGNIAKTLTLVTIPPYDSMYYYLDRGRLYFHADQQETMRYYFDTALVFFEDAARDDPVNPWLRAWLGIVYAGLGHKEEAIREGRKALEIVPYEKDPWSHPELMDGLLQIYIILDKKAEALETLELLLTMQCQFNLPRLFVFPGYAPLFDYPGFERIVEKYGNKYAKTLWERHKNKSI
jgi:TolB-like protein/Flp pilus assembly protein TadD